MPTDTPRLDWNAGARRLGGTLADPMASCGEENLPCLPRDRYAGSNVWIHELGHTIERIGLGRDTVFQYDLRAAYDAAIARGSGVASIRRPIRTGWIQ